MVETLTVELGEDHLASWVRTPRSALAELIWNGLDADASEVVVSYDLNGLDGIDAVVVRDDGRGMTHSDAAYGFAHFGDSAKRMMTYTPGGRTVHGKYGRGRYTAFSIGDHAAWESVADDDGGERRKLRVTGRRSTLKQFQLGDAYAVSEPTGTTVTIAELGENAQKVLLKEDIADELTTRFALYLARYPDVAIVYRGRRLDPERLKELERGYEVSVPGTSDYAELIVIEWAAPVERQLYLCDGNGSALHEIRPGIRARGFNFTAYLRWDGFREMGHDILLADIGGDGSPLIEAAKEQLRAHFRQRELERERLVISGWEAEGSYPYEDEPRTEAERVERQAFDVVALAAAPVVNESNETSRRLSLRLIRTALETSPEALQSVLRDVLELPAGKIEELKQLLDRTTLSSIISASKRIADRLDFISGLDVVLFDAEPRAETLERRQLHRMLANEPWIFGEEWAVTGDDERLTKVLKKYLKLLGVDVELAGGDPVLREDGREAIPDLVLSRALEPAQNEYAFLVVELKRPSHILTSDDLVQLVSYAGAVSRDERFQQPNVRWDFWLVGNDVSPDVKEQRDQVNMPFGVATQTKRYTVRVHTWAELIGNARHRLKYVRDSLDYTTSHDHGVAYLREKHAEYLPESLQGDADGDSARPYAE